MTTRIPNIVRGLDELYASHHKRGLSASRWYRDDGFDVYLRVGSRFIERTLAPWVTIANMNAITPREGLMRDVFARCEGFADQHADLAGVLVESVCNPDLLHFLAHRGYAHIGPDPLESRFMGDWIRPKS